MGITPVDLREVDKQAANVYEAIVVAAKRARQLNDEYKIEYNALVSTIPVAAGPEPPLANAVPFFALTVEIGNGIIP